MAEESGQDRTEDPTGKKKEEARQKGQVARSREFSSSMTLFWVIAFAFFSGATFVTPIVNIAKINFAFDVESIFDVTIMRTAFQDSVTYVAGVFIWLLVAIFIGAILAALFVGGWNFSLQALEPKLSNLDPVKGLKERVFSKNGLVELVKALLKFIFIGGIGMFWVYMNLPAYIGLGDMSANDSIRQSVYYLQIGFLMLVLGTFLIAAIDVPFQMYQNMQKLKMTKQEVKDEYKNTEGKPEVKMKLKQLQREIAQRKMMGNVPEADVVITNPTHFSVALRYKPDEGGAPVLIAKGGDLIALKIREIATHHKIMQVESPLLCRALFFSTEVDDEIPQGLYKAVAQVLAFVYQMNEYKKGQREKPEFSKSFTIPNEFHYDASGRRPD